MNEDGKRTRRENGGGGHRWPNAGCMWAADVLEYPDGLCVGRGTQAESRMSPKILAQVTMKDGAGTRWGEECR